MKIDQDPASPPRIADPKLRVRVHDGLVQGQLHRGAQPTFEFKGIPYTATTGGANRSERRNLASPGETACRSRGQDGS